MGRARNPRLGLIRGHRTDPCGQTLGEHAAWLRLHGYANAIIHLPHDGINANNITGNAMSITSMKLDSTALRRWQTRGPVLLL
jgi:hypothetical protein